MYVLGDYTGKIKADLTQSKYSEVEQGDALLIRFAKIIRKNNEI